MKEKILYTCEYCHTDYKYEYEAKKCEDNHSKKLKIVDKRYQAYKVNEKGFPITITVEDENGNKEIYRR
jgi:hypothetical protein